MFRNGGGVYYFLTKYLLLNINITVPGSPPVEVRCEPVSPSLLSISWKPPVQVNQLVGQGMVRYVNGWFPYCFL